MASVLQVEELCDLPSVGPATARTLLDTGYETYADLAAARPMHLHAKCDIVIASSAMIIDAAVEKLDGACPKCNREELAPIFRAWTKTLEDGSDTDSEIVCDDCGWNGQVSELAPTTDQTTASLD